MARTVSMEDVNMATSSNMFGENASSPGAAAGELREPIFKLAWSGFSSDSGSVMDRFAGSNLDTDAHKHPDGTVLTVLGGLVKEDQNGLQVLHLPAFVGPSALMGAPPAVQLREAYRASVKPMYTSLIPSDTAPEDFLLLTCDPYYGQAHSPTAITLLLSADPDLPKIAPYTERGFVAYGFPPAPFRESVELEMPAEMHLTGSQAVVLAEAVSLPSFAYKRLGGGRRRRLLPLNGGSGSIPAPARTGKSQALHHAVLSVHLDMSVRIWDYTSPAPSLLYSFSAREALSDDQLGAYLEGRMRVEKVSVAWDTAEMALALSTGHVLIYRFGYAKASAVLEQQDREQAEQYNANPTARTDMSRVDLDLAGPARSMSLEDSEATRSSSGLFGRRRASKGKEKERAGSATAFPAAAAVSNSFEMDVADISFRADWMGDGFKPVLSISAPSLRDKDRHVSCVCLSEAGFVAIAWSERLAIVDLRGPEVLYSEGSERDEHGGVAMLAWAVCAEGDDEGGEQHPKLVAAYQSGLVRVFTLSYTLDTWIVITAFTHVEHASLQRPVAVFLLDAHGNSLALTGTALDDCLRAQERQAATASAHHHHHRPQSQPGMLHTILVIVSEAAINVHANVTGERQLKRDLGPSKAVEARVVRRYGMPVLVVIMQDGQCVVFSLPRCEVVKTMHLSYERLET